MRESFFSKIVYLVLSEVVFSCSLYMFLIYYIYITESTFRYFNLYENSSLASVLYLVLLAGLCQLI